MGETRSQNRPSRDARILAAVERCSAVRPCVLKHFYVEDGMIRIILYLLASHADGRPVRPAETCRLSIPASYGRRSIRAL